MLTDDMADKGLFTARTLKCAVATLPGAADHLIPHIRRGGDWDKCELRLVATGSNWHGDDFVELEGSWQVTLAVAFYGRFGGDLRLRSVFAGRTGIVGLRWGASATGGIR